MSTCTKIGGYFSKPLRHFIARTTMTEIQGISPCGQTTENIEKIYEKAHEHWNSIASNVDGMLGGFAHLHPADIAASKEFIQALRRAKLLLHNSRAIDCGCGIGRVTKHLLLPLFRQVDMVDFAEEFLKNSRRYIGDKDFRRIKHQFVDSLHNFEPTPCTYDLIWIQWVAGQLSDEHLIQFLKRCQRAVQPGGCIVFKENVASGEKRDFDEGDHSWTRPRAEMLELFRRSGCKVVGDKKQTGFPKGMYEVRMFALKPGECQQEEEEVEESELKKVEEQGEIQPRSINNQELCVEDHVVEQFIDLDLSKK